MVYFLLSEGSDFSHKSIHGLDALFIATQLGSLDIVFVLLNHGCNPDTTNSEGDTPLYWTLKFDDTINTIEIQRLLISFGTNLAHQNNNLDNGLHILAQSTCFDPYIGLMLYGDGKHRNEKNKLGKTPRDVKFTFF